MTFLGIGFLTPWLLAALIALPILWLILRAVPPAPIRRFFPGVILLLGLKDQEQVSDRTPWWLLLLRMLALAALIFGLAGPILNPQERAEATQDRLLVVLDGTWGSANDWTAHQRALERALRDAAEMRQTVAFVQLTAPEPIVFQSADTARTALPGLTPKPYSYTDLADLELPDGGFDTLWVSDGLAHGPRADLLAQLRSQGEVRVLQSARPVIGLRPARYVDGVIEVPAYRTPAAASEHQVLVQGRDPAGNEATLAEGTLRFEAESTQTTLELAVPAELRARITRFEIEGTRSAGAVSLTDDSLQRREVALLAGREDREGLELLSPLHYLTNALEPNADLLRGPLLDILPARPDVIVLADIATLAPAEKAALTTWVEEGGLLLRFAGPRVAASELSQTEEDPLMPVRLRAGGRTVGGAMSWGEPKSLAPFPPDSPFAGLDIPDNVAVTAQVLAQPDPTLAERVIAQLADGTPLVTRKRLAAGQIVLFHVTANAEWSSLPLSGLFVQMLERLAVSTSPQALDADALEGTTWQAAQVMDAFGALDDAGNRPGVSGPDLAEGVLGPDLLPGVYENDGAAIARNVLGPEETFAPFDWPAGIPVMGLSQQEETPLAGALLALALALLVVDVAASLWLSGRIGGVLRATATLLCLGLFFAPQAHTQALAQTPVPAEEARQIAVASEVTLAHVLTGNTRLDDISAAGLKGLSQTLRFRTSVEPQDPVGIDLERDELAFYPFLYWPIDAQQPLPSDAAYAKINAYLRSGGMILFDTRDADVTGFGAASPAGQRLQQLAAPLDVPPLEPIPEDHVLTRTFYLLQDFPGRHSGRAIWVEAAPPDAEKVEGMPFRNLNDGVTPVVIGGNDWASAWAIDPQGVPLLPVGRGYAGERQREIAYRFGVNLIMHVLTGNYKSDQVHVPALLDRLGQ